MRKRILLVALATSVAMGGIFASDVKVNNQGILTAYAQENPTSGECGENVTWNYKSGRLTISGDGVMEDYYYYNDGKRVPWEGYRDNIRTVVIESGVTGIGKDAFHSCGNLVSVNISDSVKTISEGAFASCEKMKIVKLPDSLTYIGNTAFAGSGLTSLEIPEGVTTIGEQAFTLTPITSLVIPSGLKNIGDSAFYNCDNLTSVELSDSVENIGNEAFANCKNLKNIKVSEDNKKYDSRNDCNGVIETQTNSLMVACTSTVIPESVTSIGKYAYAICEGLVDIKLDSNITSIDERAFLGCHDLKNIEIPDSVTSIGMEAFAACSGLESIELPKHITTIEEKAFRDTGLTRIEIPKGVVSIGTEAFRDCRKLTEVFIPDGVTIIESAAFYCCTNLTSAHIPSSVKSIQTNSFGYDKNLTIYGAKGSYAQEFATANKITFAVECKHSYKNTVTKATTLSNGYIAKECELCGDISEKTEISYIKNVMLSNEVYKYNGNIQKPSVAVYDGNGNKIASTNYTVTYANPKSKSVTAYKVTVKFKGNYSGTVIKSYKIEKAQQQLNLSVTSKKFKEKDLKKKASSFVIKATKNKGTISYVSSNKKYVTVNKYGKVTVNKGAKKGKYTITVTANSNSNYIKAVKKVTVTVY